MVIEQFTPFTAQCYLNNWFKVLSSRVTSLQSLVSRLIGTYEQSIKYSYVDFFSTIPKRITAKVKISLKFSETFSLFTFPHIFSSKLSKISVNSYVHTFTSRWLVLLIRKDLFQWISSIYRHYQMRGEWLHHTWIFLSISIYRTGKNSKISKVISRQAFDRQTPDGNEGFVIEIQYLERAFCTNIYLIDKVTGSLFAGNTTTTSNLQDFVVVSVYSIYRNWSLTYAI